MKLIDPNLELQPWKAPQAGPTIGDAVPSLYGYRTYPDALEFYTEYHGAPTSLTPAWMGAISRPLPPTSYSHLTLQFDIQFDGASVKAARVREFDIRVAVAGMGLNCSSQFNDVTGLWQITDVAGNWIDTSWKFPAFVPWHTHHVEICYLFNWAARAYLVTGASIDGALYARAGLFVPATPLAWADSVNIQVQQGLNANVVPVGYAQVMRNINLVWSES